MVSVNRRVQALILGWANLKSRAGGLDFEVAKWAAEVAKHYPSADLFMRFHVDALDVRGSSTVAKHRRMAAAVLIVPDEPTWSAVGWLGVSKLIRIESEAKRQKVCTEIAKHREAHKVHLVTERALQAIVEGVAPELFVPRPPVPETKKDREQDRMAANRALPDRGDVLAAALQRLLGSLPIIADLLTDDERKAAGITKRKVSA